MAEHQDDEQTAAEFAQAPVYYLQCAEEHEATAAEFIAEQRPWMAEGYQLLAEQYRQRAAAGAAQEQA